MAPYVRTAPFYLLSPWTIELQWGPINFGLDNCWNGKYWTDLDKEINSAAGLFCSDIISFETNLSSLHQVENQPSKVIGIAMDKRFYIFTKQLPIATLYVPVNQQLCRSSITSIAQSIKEYGTNLQRRVFMWHIFVQIVSLLQAEKTWISSGLIITVPNEFLYKRKRLLLRISAYLVCTSDMNEMLIASDKLKYKKRMIISQV
jgi:hypothetical protein